jgi:ABC-type Mn2+/Zn2+ transport system ATPase subunit
MSEQHHAHCAHHGKHHELAVRDLDVRYHAVHALEDVSFSTICGNCMALVGPNGAGKSTLLKSICGLVRADRGGVLWRGDRVGKWSREIAYLPQREAVDWNFPVTVRGVVQMGRYPQVGWWRSFKREDDEAVDQALAAMGLADLQKRQISELSGGQQQRVFLARALAQEAHVLLLDEPFTGLDRPAQESLSRLLRQLAGEGRLVIASHHDLGTIRDIYDEVLLLRRRVIAFGAVDEVFSEARITETFDGVPAGKEVV